MDGGLWDSLTDWLANNAVNLVALATGGGLIAGQVIGRATLRIQRREAILARLRRSSGAQPSLGEGHALRNALETAQSRKSAELADQMAEEWGPVDVFFEANDALRQDGELLPWLDRLYVLRYRRSIGDYVKQCKDARSEIMALLLPKRDPPISGRTPMSRDELDEHIEFLWRWGLVYGAIRSDIDISGLFQGTPNSPQKAVHARDELEDRLVRSLRRTITSRLRDVRPSLAVVRWAVADWRARRGARKS